MARPVRFERTTLGFGDPHSIQLSYGRVPTTPLHQPSLVRKVPAVSAVDESARCPHNDTAMTLPLYLCAHLVYGVAMAFVLFPRMRAEGEVLGPPLLMTLAPVGLFTAPIGAVLVRYSGGWFLHGAFFDQGAISYERFHLAILLMTGILAGVFVVGGMFFAVAFISRDRPQLAKAPYLLAAFIVVVTLGLDWQDVITIAGTSGRRLWSHPVGLMSVGVLLILAGVWRLAGRFADVPLPSGSRPSTPPMSTPLSTPMATSMSMPVEPRA